MLPNNRIKDDLVQRTGEFTTKFKLLNPHYLCRDCFDHRQLEEKLIALPDLKDPRNPGSECGNIKHLNVGAA